MFTYCGRGWNHTVQDLLTINKNNEILQSVLGVVDRSF